MKRLLVVLLALLFTPVQAGWYENNRIDWWVVVFSQMRCAPADDFHAMLKPAPLVNVMGCEYEAEFSVLDQVASIGCDSVEVINARFIFTIDEEYCEQYLFHFNEVLQKKQKLQQDESLQQAKN